MKYPKSYSLALLLVSACFIYSCNNDSARIESVDKIDTNKTEVAIELDVSSVQELERLPIDTIEFNSTNLEMSNLSQVQLDSIKNAYQLRLDTGEGMYWTEREQYGFLIVLKNEYKTWLEENCLQKEDRHLYNIKVHNFEASIETSMRVEMKFVKEWFSEEDWGLDADMMIYGAGVDALYNYLGWLVTQYTKFKNDSNVIPPNGKYRFDIAFAEWQGKSMGEKVTVIIDGNSIKIIYEGDGQLTFTEKGDVLDEGQIMKHKSGEWIIGTNKSDIELDEVGGCTGGPAIIDFIKKKYWMC